MSEKATTPEAPVADLTIIQEIATRMAFSEGVALDVTRMREAYLALAQVAYETLLQSGSVETTFGLQHANGWVREVSSLQEAKDFKSGVLIHGRRGDWKDHTIVSRNQTTITSGWAPVAE